MRCDAKLKNPLLPWIVGSKYEGSPERLLFVGKPHRGTPGTAFPSGILDPREPHLNWLMNCSWPYWSYTKDIISNIYGDGDPWDHVAITNIIKCTNVGAENSDTSIDKTSYKMAECCIRDLGVIFREISILKPRTVILYTYSFFRDFLRAISEAIGAVGIDVTPEHHGVQCGRKILGWWERKMSTHWSENIRVLVVGHPERMKRADYVELLTNWIRQSPDKT